ncbi:MAG: DUF6787 family protein [Cytophagaceae bacterium]
MLSYFKEKWGVDSWWRLTKIFIVFAITGMSAVQVKKIIFPFIGIDHTTAWYIYYPVWLITITPFYYIFLTIYSHLFGEGPFFMAMMKKTWDRMRGKKSS